MAEPRSLGTTTQQNPSAAQAGDGRLVLTPALRVPGGADGAPANPAPVPSDEALLRQMIRDILEEELRGDFGARITRAVRRLVRAEVRTLLATRDTD